MSKHIPFEAAPGPVIILVRPQMAENVGMVARAMMNCMLSDLRLVAPRENHLSDKALAASSGAQEILTHAQVYDTLQDALADVQFVLATTARRRGMTKPVYHPEKGICLCADYIRQGARTALMFGAERTGLENDEIVSADGIIEIPLNPHHCSLNLAQAVLLTGYTWFRATQDYDNTHLETGGAVPADKREVATFLNRLQTVLDERGYFHFPDKRERMQFNLRNIFERNHLTHAEIKTLHGVLNHLIGK